MYICQLTHSDAASDAAVDYYITSHVQSACIGQDDAALDAAKVSYNIKKGFHIMEYYSSRSLKVGEKSLKELGGVYK